LLCFLALMLGGGFHTLNVRRLPLLLVESDRRLAYSEATSPSPRVVSGKSLMETFELSPFHVSGGAGVLITNFFVGQEKAEGGIFERDEVGVGVAQLTPTKFHTRAQRKYREEGNVSCC